MQLVSEMHAALALVQQKHLQALRMGHPAVEQEICKLRDMKAYYVRSQVVDIIQLTNRFVKVLVSVQLQHDLEDELTPRLPARATATRNLSDQADCLSPF